MAAKLSFKFIGDAYKFVVDNSIKGIVVPYIHEDKLFWMLLGVDDAPVAYSSDFDMVAKFIGTECELKLLCHCKEVYFEGVYSDGIPVGIVIKRDACDYSFYRIENHTVIYKSKASSYKELIKTILP